MSYLPNIYVLQNKGRSLLQTKYGWVEVPYSAGTWLLNEDVGKAINEVAYQLDYVPFPVDIDEKEVYKIGMDALKGIELNKELYPANTVNAITNALRLHLQNQNALNEAFEPLRDNADKEKEERKTNMSNTNNNNTNTAKKKEEVAVRFYEGFVTTKPFDYKQKDGTVVKLQSVKIPNGENDTIAVRRTFVVPANKIGTDSKNIHMRYVYLEKDTEYKTRRMNYIPDDKKWECLEESKMTGQQIADAFETDREKEYAAWKAKQPQDPVEEASADASLSNEGFII